MKEKFLGKNLITLDDWSKEEISFAIDLSMELKEKYKRGEITNYLINKTIFMIFFEQSTRTRNSIEAGITQLGGHAHDLTKEKMQLSHGETARDTAQVLSRMGQAIAIRNCFHNIGNKYLNEISENSDIPLISMQDDIYHPLQGIADLMTIQEEFGKNTKGLKVAISWAYATSHAKPLSVPQTQALLFPRYGMDVVVANPKEFPLDKNILKRASKRAEENGGSFKVSDSMDEAVKDADIVIPKNWGGFGSFENFEYTDENFNTMKQNLEKYKNWICDEKMFSLAKKDARVMHALPADRGNEVTNNVLDSKNSVIYEEAGNRMHTVKSIMMLLMGENK
jgi:ornithine carbamoyltransferase